MQNQGIVTVAFGTAARRTASHLILSIRKHAPDVPVCVVSDGPVDYADVNIIRVPHGWSGRYYKVYMNDYAPAEWQQILWLDADTLVIDKLDLFWQALVDGWDMVMTLGPDWANTVLDNQRPKQAVENTFTSQVLGGRFWLQPMAGVLAWRRNARTAELFREWANEWSRYGRRDQPALIRALWGVPVRAYWLGTEWNYFLHRGNPERGEVVLHFPTAARMQKVDHPGKRLWQEYVKRV